MSSISNQISEVFVTQDAIEHFKTNEILRKLTHLSPVIITKLNQLRFNPLKNPYKIAFNKKRILLTIRKDKFIEKCPGTKNHLCCNYYVIKNLIGCNLDCSYCYLQYFHNSSCIIAYVNYEDLILEVENLLANNPNFFWRIGTGEFSDSFSLEYLLQINPLLINSFAKFNNAILELKTKSDEIKNILNLNHKGRTIIAWSVNTKKVIENEELFTLPLEQRINSARLCVEAGYKVAFHFDPLIYYVSWKKDYNEVVNLIFDIIPQNSIAWISLGALRFHPDLKVIIKKRFPNSKIVYAEFIKGIDNKYRYFVDIRLELFNYLKEIIRKRSKIVPLYLCMESNKCWRKTFSALPYQIKNLENIFN